MSAQELWTAEAQIDEDLQGLTQSIANYNQDAVYEPGLQPQIDEATFAAMQQHMAQQAAFAQVPDVVKRV